MESLSMNQTVSNNTSWTQQSNNKNIFEYKWGKKWIHPKYSINPLKINSKTNNIYIKKLLLSKKYGINMFKKDKNGIIISDLCDNTNETEYNNTIFILNENDSEIILKYNKKEFKLNKSEWNQFTFYSIINTCINYIKY